jgi:hypothetical protein
MTGLVYAAHQPDLLPYTGFFYKMYHADVFDLKVWDQFVNRGYQRRVMMRDNWVTIPLEKCSSTESIFNVRLKPEAPDVLVNDICNRYERSHKAKHWDKYGPMICDEILSIRTDKLWDFNFRLILLIRDILGIQTPITFGRPVTEGLRGSEGLISAMQIFPPPLTYLSGTGAKVYMGDCQEFTDAGIEVDFSRHQHTSGDSILTTLFDYENPLEIVLKEKED